MNQHEEKKKEGDVRLVLPSFVFSLFFLILFFFVCLKESNTNWRKESKEKGQCLFFFS